MGIVAVTAGVVALFAAPAAMAQTETAAAVITQPDAVTPLNSGGSTTSWTIQLPTGSHCTGDTHTNGYTINSYITSVSDPSTLTFNASGPVAASGVAYPLYDINGNGYTAEPTAVGTGVIGQTPTLNDEFFNTDGSGGDYVLAPGTYNVGIACATRTGTVDQFWNVQEVFTASGTDPNGETWAVVPATSVPESPLAVALPIAAVLVLASGVAVVVFRRRRHPAGPVVTA